MRIAFPRLSARPHRSAAQSTCKLQRDCKRVAYHSTSAKAKERETHSKTASAIASHANKHRNHHAIEVEAINLSAFLGGLTATLTAIKLDVEGAELQRYTCSGRLAANASDLPRAAPAEVLIEWHLASMPAAELGPNGTRLAFDELWRGACGPQQPLPSLTPA